MLDTVDELILSALSKNSKQDLHEMGDYIRDYGYNLTIDEIRSRIKILEDEKVILGYTISINIKKVKHKKIRVVLMTFRSSNKILPILALQSLQTFSITPFIKQERYCM